MRLERPSLVLRTLLILFPLRLYPHHQLTWIPKPSLRFGNHWRVALPLTLAAVIVVPPSVAHRDFLRSLSLVSIALNAIPLCFPHALTVRPLTKEEVLANSDGYASIDKEWKRLRDRKAWDESVVREWYDVAAEARRTGHEVHMGMLFGFVVERIPICLRVTRAESSKDVLCFRATTWSIRIRKQLCFRT